MNDHLSVGDRWRIISLNSDRGLNARQIARIIRCTIPTVYNIVELFEETNDVTERSGRGRNAMLNDNEIHAFRQMFYFVIK